MSNIPKEVECYVFGVQDVNAGIMLAACHGLDNIPLQEQVPSLPRGHTDIEEKFPECMDGSPRSLGGALRKRRRGKDAKERE